MVRARPLASLSATVVAAALIFAACGGDDDDTATSTPVASEPAATVSAETDAPVETAAAETVPAETVPAETVPAETAPVETDAPETTAAAAGSVIDVATEAGTFTIFLAAVDTAGLTDELKVGKYTLLAPTDETIAAAMDQASIDAMLADPAQALALVNLHVLPGAEDAHTIGVFNSVVTLSGGSLDVTEDGDVVVVQGAKIVTPDIAADNGFVHVIDSVITNRRGLITLTLRALYSRAPWCGGLGGAGRSSSV